MEEAHFIFTSEPIELKSEGENFFVEGYISTSDLDLVNDIVTKSCLMDMAEQMKSRVIKFDVEHESFRGKSNLEREINKTIIPAAKIDDFLIDKKGLKVRALLNRHSNRFDEVKGSIEDGFLDAFSIAYVPIKSTNVTKQGKQVRMLDKINLLNVAFTGNPVNTEAKMVNVFMKSLEFLGKQEKSKQGPGGGRADGSGMDEEDEETDEEGNKKKKKKKSHTHESELTKLKEVKQMSEENEKVDEDQEAEETESETESKNKKKKVEEEEEDEKKKKEESKELAEVKSRLDKTEKELAEVKALIKKPVLKSKVEQEDKSNNFVEKKSQNPLDFIA